MKKIAVVVLVVCLVLFCFTTTAYAEVKLPSEFMCKYTESLEQKLLTMDGDDEINLVIWLNYQHPDNYGVREEDYDTPEEFKSARTKAAKIYHTEMNAQYLAVIAQYAEFEVTYSGVFSKAVMVTAKASEVPKMVPLEQIAGIEWNDTPAEPLPSPTEFNHLYERNFANQVGLSKYDPENPDWEFGTYRDYEEIYYHTSVQGAAPDWVLVKVHVEMYNDWEKIPYRQFGSRVLIGWRIGADIYPFELALYNTAEDKFYSVDDYMDYYMDPEEKFPGLTEAIEALGLGYELGDADMNGDVEIIDATIIQRYEAMMKTPLDPAYEQFIPVLGDLDGDGLDIVDVTMLQRRLANFV